MLLYGKPVVEALKLEIDEKIKNIANNYARMPKLCVISFNNSNVADRYTLTRKKLCESYNILFQNIIFKETATEQEIIERIEILNNDSNLDAIMIDTPLPTNVNAEKIFNTISVEKDIESMSTINLGLLVNDNAFYSSPTALAVMRLLDFYKYDIKFKNVVIIGRSKSVGLQLFYLCLNLNATVTVCHSQTKNLLDYTKRADFLIVATNKMNLISKEHVNKNCVVIDVGIHFDSDGKICGEVCKDVEEACLAITPVPLGIGPITNYIMIKNLLKAFDFNNDVRS